jgi:hypothetical protein
VITVETLHHSIDRFVSWLEKAGYSSYDPYDIWGLPFALRGRKFFYRNSLAALPMIAPFLIIDMVAPGLRKVLVKKQRFATADAQLLLAFINLFHVRGDNTFLERAIRLGDEILDYSIKGYSGYCWGYPFDWQNSEALWRKNTPYITATPYCFEAFLKLYDITGKQRYLDIARSIAQFVSIDLNDTRTSSHAAAGSYSPIDESKVVNASAYRAMVLMEAYRRFGIDTWRDQAIRNVNFICESQHDNGAWLYEVDNKSNNYIDHFHTCFVLKNLYKLNIIFKSRRVTESVHNGYAYYRKHLFMPDGTPKCFAIEHRKQLVVIDLYNFAESITLNVLLRKEIPESLPLAETLAHTLCNVYHLENGYFVTKVYRGGFRHTFPFLRWSQAQCFYALTNLVNTLTENVTKIRQGSNRNVVEQ